MIMYKKVRSAKRAGLTFLAGRRGQLSNRFVDDLTKINLFVSENNPSFRLV